MKTMYDVIRRPIMTEKSMADAENGKYTFEVSKTSNKTEIKQAIEKIFKVKVLSINTINVLPKDKRVGKYAGKKPAYKKAIVQLDKGQKIKVFEV